ncbi:MAG TPA: iron-sulfur cluster biosynthesis family protein [Nitrospiria bacterium]|jgi:Fe-S cluster assembly iron-binding protein IscA
MIKVTPQAVEKLNHLLREHPEENCVRVRITDLGEDRRVFHITLEEAFQPGDQVQESYDLTIGIPEEDAQLMEGATLDYDETEGFKVQHPNSEENGDHDPFQLN